MYVSLLLRLRNQLNSDKYILSGNQINLDANHIFVFLKESFPDVILPSRNGLLLHSNTQKLLLVALT